MAVYIRAKRVTDPLDERVRARLRGTITGCASSGSEHDGTASVEHSCFSNLTHGFLEPGGAVEGPDRGGSGEDSDSDDGDAMERAAEQGKKLGELLEQNAEADPFGLLLRSEVYDALRLSTPGLRLAVMARLRERGHNAGICKARWETARGLTAGSYEYIDVIVHVGVAGKEERRYIIDLGFASEFEVARPTEEYVKVVGVLPRTLVARPEEVQAVVQIVAEAAQQSLQKMGMSVPPWRKKRYMLAKWLGPYCRTLNLCPAAEGSLTEASLRYDSKAMPRTIGFGDPVVCGLPVPGACNCRAVGR